MMELLRELRLVGRSFQRVAVVSQGLAERFWPGESPLGQMFSHADPELGWPFSGETFEVVGVVADVVTDPREPVPPQLYLAAEQKYPENTHFAVRFAAGDPLARVAEVEQVVWAADPLQPLWDVETLEQRWLDRMWRERLALVLLGFFSVVGLLLAASGVFGLVSFSVTERTREIGVAAALGADRRRLAGRELRRALKPAGLGVAIGLPTGVALTLLAQRALPAIASWNGALSLGAAIALGGIATLAALVPTYRAARMDPARALRGGA